MDRIGHVQDALSRLQNAARALARPLTFMEVCGTHTMAAFRSGLHSLLPQNVRLLSGPGCPVCVTAQGDIDLLIEAASHPNVTLCTYGDMIRVPGRSGSLEKSRGQGADVRIIYSTLDAVSLAEKSPDRHIVLAAVGFETTAPATAAAILEARRKNLKNFSVLASHKRVVPAMLALLAGGKVNLDGFLCPGHVSVVLGWEVYRPIVTQYKLPCVIGGFEEPHLADALARLVELVRDNDPALENTYPEAVSPLGNKHAQKLLDDVFETADVRWRGLGVIPGSGMVLRPEFASFDAAKRLNMSPAEDYEHPGCICGQVISGLATPHDCKLFGTACSPIHPIGPCMVSSEGTCAAYFKYARAKSSSATNVSSAHDTSSARQGWDVIAGGKASAASDAPGIKEKNALTPQGSNCECLTACTPTVGGLK